MRIGKSVMRALIYAGWSLFLLPAISLAQSTSSASASSDNSLFPALMAVKSEEESKVLLNWHLGELHHSQGDDLKAIEFSNRAAALADRINLPGIGYLALTLKGKAHLAFRSGRQGWRENLLTIL